MPRQKKEENIATGERAIKVVEITKIKIDPITEHFNIGDLNTLRDKINEIIKAL